MQRTGFARVVLRDRDHMYRWSLVSHPDMATLLTNHTLPNPLQRADQPISGN
jgi:hypothetical protein